MKLQGDARRRRQLDHAKARWDRYTLTNERYAIEQAIREALLHPDRVERDLRIRALKERHAHVLRSWQEASARAARLAHELGSSA